MQVRDQDDDGWWDLEEEGKRQAGAAVAALGEGRPWKGGGVNQPFNQPFQASEIQWQNNTHSHTALFLLKISIQFEDD